MPKTSISKQWISAFLLGILTGIGIQEVSAILSEQIYHYRMMKGTEMLEELKKPWVRIKDREFVQRTIAEIIQDGKDHLQVIADFDRTITRFSIGDKVLPTSFGILDNSALLPEEYRDEAEAMRLKYHAIEIDPEMSIAEKIPYMIEWWTKAQRLLVQYQLRKDDLHKMVQDSDLMLREGSSSMFERLEQMSVPLLIFSAGIGDVINEGLCKCAKYHSNMKIISNFMDFNGQGLLTGFHGDLIHTYNKNENAIHNSDYFRHLGKRHNVILLGDSLGDLRMADGAPSKNCLKIGFLNDKLEESLAAYMDGYDVVLLADDTMDVMNAILREIC